MEYIDKNGCYVQRRKMYIGLRNSLCIQRFTTWEARSNSIGKIMIFRCRTKWGTDSSTSSRVSRSERSTNRNWKRRYSINMWSTKTTTSTSSIKKIRIKFRTIFWVKSLIISITQRLLPLRKKKYFRVPLKIFPNRLRIGFKGPKNWMVPMHDSISPIIWGKLDLQSLLKEIFDNLPMMEDITKPKTTKRKRKVDTDTIVPTFQRTTLH